MPCQITIQCVTVIETSEEQVCAFCHFYCHESADTTHIELDRMYFPLLVFHSKQTSMSTISHGGVDIQYS